VSAVAAEVPSQIPALHWRRQDAFHTRSECGRYTVSRVDLGDCNDYIAWRCSDLQPTELSFVRVSGRATDEERKGAIASMQRICLEDLERSQ
jgi:hypothetical protein